jgi:DNA-binding transcriptional regulator PaaX
VLVATYRHFPFRDPGLPAELLPSDWADRRAHELFVQAHEALAVQANAYVASDLNIDGPRSKVEALVPLTADGRANRALTSFQ